jgi:hypothetical protein
MLTHLKFQGTTPLVGVALLMRLGSQDVCTDLLHFLFYLCHNVGTKDTLSPGSDQLSGVQHGRP